MSRSAFGNTRRANGSCAQHNTLCGRTSTLWRAACSGSNCSWRVNTCGQESFGLTGHLCSPSPTIRGLRMRTTTATWPNFLRRRRRAATIRPFPLCAATPPHPRQREGTAVHASYASAGCTMSMRSMRECARMRESGASVRRARQKRTVARGISILRREFARALKNVRGFCVASKRLAGSVAQAPWSCA